MASHSGTKGYAGLKRLGTTAIEQLLIVEHYCSNYTILVEQLKRD